MFLFNILGANPVWNPEEEDGPKVKNRINPLYKNDQDDDTDSDSSGDNVIIGVEDQDDFKDYQDRYSLNSDNSSNNVEWNPNDFASFALPLDKYSRTNPLFDESEM